MHDGHYCLQIIGIKMFRFGHNDCKIDIFPKITTLYPNVIESVLVHRGFIDE